VGELCGRAGVNSVTLCRPLPYGLHAEPLKRGRWNPRKGYGSPPRARTGRRRDVGPVERVSSVTVGPVRPSPPLYHHFEHFNDIPGVVGAQDDKTLPHPLLCNLQPSVSPTLELTHGHRPNRRLPHHYHPNHSWTGTGLATTPARSEIRQDDQQLHVTARHTAICSLELCGTIGNRLPLA
jgi:hypothetical protein